MKILFISISLHPFKFHTNSSIFRFIKKQTTPTFYFYICLRDLTHLEHLGFTQWFSLTFTGLFLLFINSPPSSEITLTISPHTSNLLIKWLG